MRPRVSARSRRIRVIFGCRHGVRVAFLSFGEVVVLKAYFFSAQFFLSLLLPLSFWGFPEFVYGIHLIFFESRVSSPFRSVPSVLRVRGSAPCVRARRSSFSPRRARKAERACRVVSGAYRAKRVAENES